MIPEINTIEIDLNQKKDIQVEVKGAVENPGVFYVPAYSTVEELFKIVELRNDADIRQINQTMVLKNNDVIVIPYVKENSFKVSINSGSIEELMMLPGIGKVTATNIVNYRNEHGFFQSIDDLVKVKGIGAKTLNKIREFLCL